MHLFVKLDEEELVCRFAQDPDPKVTAYLVKKCEELPNFNRNKTANMLLILFSQNYPDAPRLLMDILEKGGAKQFYLFAIESSLHCFLYYQGLMQRDCSNSEKGYPIKV